MKQIVLVVVASIIFAISFSCKRSSSDNAREDATHVDTLLYIDSVYVHKMGENYIEGDSSQDVIWLYKPDNHGRILQAFNITDSVSFRYDYDYSYLPDSIIKRTFIMMAEQDTFEEAFISVYELNDKEKIIKLTQRVYGVNIETEYQYDFFETRLRGIDFKSNNTSCNWLWKGDEIDKIVYEEEEYMTQFTYWDNIPFSSCFYHLPNLDYVLSIMGFYGRMPSHAIQLSYDIIDDSEYYNLEANHYVRGEFDVAFFQRSYYGINEDSIDCYINWELAEVKK